MNIVFKITTISILIFACAATGYHTRHYIYISGIVNDENGRPINDVKIEIRPLNDSVLYNDRVLRVTSESGKFVLKTIFPQPLLLTIVSSDSSYLKAYNYIEFPGDSIFLRFVMQNHFSKNKNMNGLANIVGVVTNEKGEAITGTSISLKEVIKGAFANYDGFYEIKGITPGEYTLRAATIDFQPLQSNKIILNSGETININFVLTQIAIYQSNIIKI